MKATEKEHAIRRINNAAENLIKALTTLEKPTLVKHVQKAVIEGTVKTRPLSELLEMARKAVVDNSSDYQRLRLSEIFAEPATYKRELTAYEAEQKSTAAKREKIKREAQRIIDAIHFGKITDPAEAIAQMEQFRA